MTAVSSIDDYLRAAPDASTRRDYEVLIAAALGVTRAHLFAHGRDLLERDAIANVERHLKDYRAGTPIAYVLGRRDFWALTLEVTSDVLIPRTETELLVELALQRLPDAARVLDLGTGSGAIALALKHARPDAMVFATDVSRAALEVARRNAVRLGLEIELVSSDWFAALATASESTFDVIVSNPPYVRADDPHLDTLVGEPRLALIGGSDGLHALRRIVAGAPDHLRRGGVLLVEHGYDQGEPVRDLFARAAFRAVATHRDAAGHERVTLGTR